MESSELLTRKYLCHLGLFLQMLFQQRNVLIGIFWIIALYKILENIINFQVCKEFHYFRRKLHRPLHHLTRRANKTLAPQNRPDHSCPKNRFNRSAPRPAFGRRPKSRRCHHLQFHQSPPRLWIKM
jgi:hypothetical protein